MSKLNAARVAAAAGTVLFAMAALDLLLGIGSVSAVHGTLASVGLALFAVSAAFDAGRSPGTDYLRNRSVSHVTAGGSLGESERRGEARSGVEADVSGERRVRDIGVSKATILLPVDGSKVSEDAVRHVIRLSTSGMAMKVYLLNVQGEWPPPRSEYEKREGVALQIRAAAEATQSARALLAGASLDFESHMRVGTVADVIVRLAREKRCHKIVMGTRRLGTIAGFVLGSVASRVLRRTAVPVTLVKET